MNKDDKGIEDLYDIKTPGRGLYLLLAIIAIVIIAFWVFSTAEKPKQKEAFLNMCENMMIESGSNYTVCCVDGDELTDCTNKKTFGYNDYIIVEANLLALNKVFNVYHVCMFYTPLETTIKTGVNETDEIYVGDEAVTCRTRLKNEYQHVKKLGYIRNLGKITLMKIYIFPVLGYNTTQEFAENINRGILVLNLTADVE